MAIRPRGPNWQADFSFQGVRYRHDFPTRSEAIKWESEVKLAALSSKPVNSTGLSDKRRGVRLGYAFDQLYERVWKQQKSHRTHRQSADVVLDIIGDIHLSRIGPETIDNAIKKMEERRYAPGTINRKLAALSKVLRFAHKRGWIPGVPHVERQREPKGRLRFYTAEEEAAVAGYFRQIGKEHMADFFEFLIDTGLRRGEALALRTADVRNGNTIVHEGKTKASVRSVPQTQRVRLLVARRLLARPHHEDRLFWGMTKNTVEHDWSAARTALGKAGDDEWVLHTCRHTFVSRLVQRGVPLMAVMGLAGHSSITVTQRYAHLAAGNYADAIRKLEPQSPTGPQFANTSHIAMM